LLDRGSYSFSDPGAEEALYDIQSMRAFAGLELGRDAIPDETTILNFRNPRGRHDLTKAIFATVAEHLAVKGELLRGGTIVGETLIAASPSMKNKEQRRDPQISQSKRGNQWWHEAHRRRCEERARAQGAREHGQGARREGDGQPDPRG